MPTELRLTGPCFPLPINALRGHSPASDRPSIIGALSHRYRREYPHFQQERSHDLRDHGYAWIPLTGCKPHAHHRHEAP